MPKLLLILLASGFGLYLVFVATLYLTGKRTQARAVGGFIPDCLVLFKRLLGDKRVGRKYKVIVVLLIGYLSMPFDVVPDFIPIAGQLDDAIIVALVLRWVIEGAGKEVVTEQWPGPDSSIDALLRLINWRQKD
jgi:uncharacterized membrane protein YkvA (DUF1232 family)